MCIHLLDRVRHLGRTAIHALRRHLLRRTRSATAGSLVLGAAADLARSRSELVAENALLRQQLIVLARTAKRPRLTRADRPLLVLLASRVRAWRQALPIVRPETLLRCTGRASGWSGAGDRPRAAARQGISPDTIALIERMARENRLWGAERIRGELAKLGIRASKRTIQKHLRRTRPRRPSGQSWRTFLRNHAGETWACDVLQLTDLLVRPAFAFFIVELGSRRVVHVGVTRSPTGAWAAQQLREATPDATRPRFLIRDHDAKYGAEFDRVAAASGVGVIRTPIRAPRANAVRERFLGSVRRECVDHVLVVDERQLRRVLAEYVVHVDQARPHQGLDQRTPAASGVAARCGGAARRAASSESPCWAGSTTSTVASPDAAGWPG